MARGPRGIGRFRRLIRQLPGETAGEIIVELNVTGEKIQRAVTARAPLRRGRLRAGLARKVLPASLRLQVGLLGTPAGRAKLFYGRIQDLGRLQQIVNVVRRANKAAAKGRGQARKGRGLLNRGQPRRTGDPYRMQVPGMEAKRFVTGSYPDLRRELRGNLTGIFARSLRKISGGTGE